MVEWRSPKPFIRVRVLVNLSSRYWVIDWESWLNFDFSFIDPLVIVGYQLPHKSSCHNGYWSRLLICRAKAHCRFESYRGRSNQLWTGHTFMRTNKGCSQMEYVHHRKIENERWLITRCYWRIIILVISSSNSIGRVADFNKRLIINNLHEKDKPHGAIMRKLIIRMA